MASNGSSRPVIGITTYVEPARWGSWDRDAALLPHSYVTTVVAAGGAPVLLPPVPDGAEAVVGTLDGLLISGGADVDPALYGQDAHAATDRPRTDRDSWEADLLRLALDRHLPVLAVCRGLQVLNVALGGTLHQHLPEVCGHDGHRPVPGTYGTSTVDVVAGSRLAEVLGAAAVDGHGTGGPSPTGVAPSVEVPCHHHQAVDRVGDGLVVSARATDGTIEGLELDDPDRWVVAVQWHPEDGTDPRLAEAFVQTARSGGSNAGADFDTCPQNEEGRSVS